MKDHISVIRKDRGVAKGSLNPNAKPIVMINIYTLEVHKFLSAYDAQKHYHRVVIMIHYLLFFRKASYSKGNGFLYIRRCI